MIEKTTLDAVLHGDLQFSGYFARFSVPLSQILPTTLSKPQDHIKGSRIKFANPTKLNNSCTVMRVLWNDFGWFENMMIN